MPCNCTKFRETLGTGFGEDSAAFRENREIQPNVKRLRELQKARFVRAGPERGVLGAGRVQAVREPSASRDFEVGRERRLLRK